MQDRAYDRCHGAIRIDRTQCTAWKTRSWRPLPRVRHAHYVLRKSQCECYRGGAERFGLTRRPTGTSRDARRSYTRRPWNGDGGLPTPSLCRKGGRSASGPMARRWACRYRKSFLNWATLANRKRHRGDRSRWPVSAQSCVQHAERRSIWRLSFPRGQEFMHFCNNAECMRLGVPRRKTSRRKKTRAAFGLRGFFPITSLTITYFHTGCSTIIGVISFHGPVRDGKGWYRFTMVIRHDLYRQPSPAGRRRHESGRSKVLLLPGSDLHYNKQQRAFSSPHLPRL